MRFYRNNLFGEEKNQKSFEIFVNQKVDLIIDEIHNSIESDIKEVSEQIFNNLLVSHAVEDKKNVLVYFYDDERISLHFKALSSMQILKDDFVFMSLFDPSETVTQGFQLQKLPSVAGILKADGDDISTAKQFNYGG